MDVVFDQTPVGLLISTLDGRWNRVNRKLSELLGFSSEELLYYMGPDLGGRRRRLLHNEQTGQRAVRRRLLSSHPAAGTATGTADRGRSADGVVSLRAGLSSSRAESQSVRGCQVQASGGEQEARRLAVSSLMELEIRPGRYETKHCRPDGSMLWLRLTSSVVNDMAGQPQHYITVFEDIHMDRLNFERWRRTEGWLTQSCALASMGVWMWDIRSQRLLWDSTCHRCFGVPKGEFPGTIEFFNQVVHPDDLPLVWRAVNDSIKHDVDCNVRYRVFWPDGSLHLLAVLAKNEYDEDGEVLRMNGVIVEVPSLENPTPGLLKGAGDGKRAQTRTGSPSSASSSTHAETAGTVIEALGHAVWTATPDGTMDYYNQAWYDLTGIKSGEKPPKNFLPLMAAEDSRQFVEDWNTALTSGEGYEREHRFWDHEKNMYRWYLTKVVPIKGPDGSVTKWVGTYTDIQSQKEAAEKKTEPEAGKKKSPSSLSSRSESLTVWAVDSDLAILFFDDALARQLKLEVSALRGRNLLTVYKVGQDKKRLVNRALRGETVTFRSTVNGIKVETECHPMVKATEDGKGKLIVGVLGIVTVDAER